MFTEEAFSEQNLGKAFTCRKTSAMVRFGRKLKRGLASCVEIC